MLKGLTVAFCVCSHTLTAEGVDALGVCVRAVVGWGVVGIFIQGTPVELATRLGSSSAMYRNRKLCRRHGPCTRGMRKCSQHSVILRFVSRRLEMALGGRGWGEGKPFPMARSFKRRPKVGGFVCFCQGSEFRLGARSTESRF